MTTHEGSDGRARRARAAAADVVPGVWVEQIVAAVGAAGSGGASGERAGGLVVAIDGRSGSGKTSLALALASRWPVPVVAMDDLYPGWDGLLAAPGLLAGTVLGPRSVGRVGGPGRDGSGGRGYGSSDVGGDGSSGVDGRVGYRCWDWTAGRWGGSRPLPRGDRLIVEGCGSSAAEARAWISLSVWVEVPERVRRARALARDGDLFAPHWDRWARAEDALFGADDTRRRADLVLQLPGGGGGVDDLGADPP